MSEIRVPVSETSDQKRISRGAATPSKRKISEGTPENIVEGATIMDNHDLTTDPTESITLEDMTIFKKKGVHQGEAETIGLIHG